MPQPADREGVIGNASFTLEDTVHSFDRRRLDYDRCIRPGQRVQRRQIDNGTAGSTYPSLPYSRDWQRQLSTQELNHQHEGDKTQEKEQDLSHNRLSRVGQFSVQINTLVGGWVMVVAMTAQRTTAMTG